MAKYTVPLCMAAPAFATLMAMKIAMETQYIRVKFISGYEFVWTAHRRANLSKILITAPLRSKTTQEIEDHRTRCRQVATDSVWCQQRRAGWNL